MPADNLYTPKLSENLTRISADIIPKVRSWPHSFSMVSVLIIKLIVALFIVSCKSNCLFLQTQMELCNPENMYGLQQRIVGVESCISLVQQLQQLKGYLEHLLPIDNRGTLQSYLAETVSYIYDVRKPVFMCVTARMIDLPNVMTAMGKVKWDINDVNVEHSLYVDTVNRVSENAINHNDLLII